MLFFSSLRSQAEKILPRREKVRNKAYMSNRKSAPTKKLIHLLSCCNPDLYRDTGIEQCNPKGFLLRLKIVSLFRHFYKCFKKGLKHFDTSFYFSSSCFNSSKG